MTETRGEQMAAFDRSEEDRAHRAYIGALRDARDLVAAMAAVGEPRRQARDLVVGEIERRITEAEELTP